MNELRELYQEMIIEHGRHPRNFCVLENASCKQEGFNPLCGDHLILFLIEKNGVIENISFQGSGCAISMASASLMTDAVKNKSIKEAEKLFQQFHLLITENKSEENLGKLAVLAGVSEFPARVKCATLAWHTLKAALQNETQTVSTE